MKKAEMNNKVKIITQPKSKRQKKKQYKKYILSMKYFGFHATWSEIRWNKRLFDKLRTEINNGDRANN